MTSGVDSIHRHNAEARFADLVEAEFKAQHDPDLAAHVEADRKAFTERFGPIIYSRFGQNIPCGVALTDNRVAADQMLAALEEKLAKADSQTGWPRWARVPRWKRQWQQQERKLVLTEQRKPVHLYLVLPEPTSATTPVLGRLSKCKTQAVYTGRFLQDEDLRQCLTLLYWPADELIARADADAVRSATDQSATSSSADPPPSAAPARKRATTTKNPGSDQFIDVVDQQLADADEYYQHFSQRTIRMAYFRGILFGMLGIILVFLLLYMLGRFTIASTPTALLWSIMAGALGALTSILSSATFGRIILDRAAGGTWNTVLGAFRPVIGALFGAAFYVLINAGFLPVKIPSASSVALYASIAFLAGFSHRWAQDTFKSAEGKIPAPSRTPGGAAEPDNTIKSA